MSGNALPLRPVVSPTRFRGSAEFLAAVLLGRIDEPEHPSVAALTARARTEARAAERAGREQAGSEDLTTLKLVYVSARAGAAAPAKTVPAGGPRWERALRALAVLRHRQRSVLALYHVLGLDLDEVASIVGVRPKEARTVVEAGVAQVARALGEPADVRRALRTAGSRILTKGSGDPEAAPKPVRMPRAVVRTLIAPQLTAETEAPPVVRAPPPAAPAAAAVEPAEPPRLRPVELLISDEVLERIEREGSHIVPPPTPTPSPSRDIRPVPRRAARGPFRRRLLWAAAALAVLGAALLPAGASQDAPPPVTSEPLPVVEAAQPAEVAGPVEPIVPEAIVVRRGDSLWRIAGAELGDPMRWGEIWRLNRGRVMRDGERFTDPSLIRPGWRLRLPDR